ncbi:MAG: hypothetical protein ABSE22_23890, partial [Xanthobacteraceae bacterium]
DNQLSLNRLDRRCLILRLTHADSPPYAALISRSVATERLVIGPDIALFILPQLIQFGRPLHQINADSFQFVRGRCVGAIAGQANTTLRLLAQVRGIDPNPRIGFGGMRHYRLPAPYFIFKFRVGAPMNSHVPYVPDIRGTTDIRNPTSYEGPGGAGQ